MRCASATRYSLALSAFEVPSDVVPTFSGGALPQADKISAADNKSK